MNSFVYFYPSSINSHIFGIDDDEGDIFEEYEEEDEGYLFAGQGIV
jgi:hypothetical protein